MSGYRYLCIYIHVWYSLDIDLKLVGHRWAAAVAPFLTAATGQGHRTGRPLYRPPSRARRTRAEALARADRPSQKDFKLVGPCCCCTVATVPGRCHKTGPPGRQAIVQATFPSQTHPGRSSGACGPSQSEDFKLVAGPCCCCTVPGRGHSTGPPGRLAIIQSAVTVPGRIGIAEALARAGRPSTRYLRAPFGTRKYLYKYIDIYGYIHRYLHIYFNIMDIYIDITESSSLLAAAAAGLGPGPLQGPCQTPATGCRD